MTRAERRQAARAEERADKERSVAQAQARNPKTYWNGERTSARKVLIRVGKSERPTWWCADLEGQERKAVEVSYFDKPFFLDDEDGSGWRKVTEGHGSPTWGHRGLPGDSVVLRELVEA